MTKEADAVYRGGNINKEGRTDKETRQRNGTCVATWQNRTPMEKRQLPRESKAVNVPSGRKSQTNIRTGWGVHLSKAARIMITGFHMKGIIQKQ